MAAVVHMTSVGFRRSIARDDEVNSELETLGWADVRVLESDHHGDRALRTERRQNAATQPPCGALEGPVEGPLPHLADSPVVVIRSTWDISAVSRR